MEKIIICGNDNQVKEIKERLTVQEHEIAVLDLNEKNFSEDFFKTAAVFIAADDSQENLILGKMRLAGNDIKVINYSRFRNTSLENPIECINNDIQYTGLIMGMSHSQCAIKSDLLTDNLYCNCAAPSMDIFCHLSYFKKLSEIHPEKLKSMRHIIIELPYYIFNFDLSRFGNFVYSKLNYFELIGDYHHFGKNYDQKNKIEEFKRFKQYFQPKKVAVKSSVNRNPLRKIAKKVLTNYRIAANKDKVWRILYQETIDENRKLWFELLGLLKRVCPKARVTVLIMPFNPIFRCFHKREIRKMKEVFMTSLGTEDFKILDHFDCINSVSFFDDHCHLNEKGASKYTKILQEALIREYSHNI